MEEVICHFMFFKQLVQRAGNCMAGKDLFMGLTIALCMEDHGRIETDPCYDATQHVAAWALGIFFVFWKPKSRTVPCSPCYRLYRSGQ